MKLFSELWMQALTTTNTRVMARYDLPDNKNFLHPLSSGEVDVAIDYLVPLLSLTGGSPPGVGPAKTYSRLQKTLPPRMTALDYGKVNNTLAIVVSQSTAHREHLTSIADLAGQGGSFTIALPNGVSKSGAVVALLISDYALQSVRWDSTGAGVDDLATDVSAGEFSAALVAASTPGIDENDLVMLTDPKYVFPAYNAVPVVRTGALDDDQIAAINAVSHQLTMTEFRSMLGKMQNGATASDVAKDWVTQHGIG